MSETNAPGRDVAQVVEDERLGTEQEEVRTPGTMVLVLLLLACFAVYYFANWKALSDVWQVR